jgi:hypothetical protein
VRYVIYIYDVSRLRVKYQRSNGADEDRDVGGVCEETGHNSNNSIADFINLSNRMFQFINCSV